MKSSTARRSYVISRRCARKWGRVLLVTDNASQHKHRDVKRYLKEHDGMEMLYLPTATPKLSAVESVWRDAKYRLVTSTLRDEGGPDACGVRVLQDVPNQA